MASNFDQFSFYDPLVKNGSNLMSDIWVGNLSTFFQTLVEYLTAGGILMPLLTTEQRDKLQNPTNGQLIYNTTLDSAQYFKAGVWTSF